MHLRSASHETRVQRGKVHLDEYLVLHGANFSLTSVTFDEVNVSENTHALP